MSYIKGGLNHITLQVKNLKRSDEFYTNLLGLKKVGSRPKMNFYSSGRYNHELALVENSRLNYLNNTSLLHFALNVKNKEGLNELKRKLQHADYFVSDKINHITSHSFYTQDPDGHVIELTLDQPKTEWGENPNAFKEDYRLTR